MAVGFAAVAAMSLMLYWFACTWLDLAGRIDPLSRGHLAAVAGLAAVFFAAVVLLLLALLPVELLIFWKGKK